MEKHPWRVSDSCLARTIRDTSISEFYFSISENQQKG